MVAFGAPINAIRFAHVIQLAIVLNIWPSEVMSLCGPSIPGPNHIPLFNGPRVAISIHSTKSFGVCMRENTLLPSNRLAGYDGHGIVFIKRLSSICHGGQCIVSGRTWTLVQNILPPKTQVKHFLVFRLTSSSETKFGEAYHRR